MRGAAIAVLLVLSTAANAQQPTPEAAAKFHYQEATKAFNLGEFARAATEYREAYRALPDPIILYNIAQSYRLANDLPQALFFYRSYLRNTPNVPNRAEVDDRIRKLDAQIKQQQAVVTQPPNTTAQPGAGKIMSNEPPPAEHVPPASATPAPEPKRSAEPAPPVEKSAGAPALTGSAPPREKRSSKKWVIWTAVGAVVVVGVGLGVGLGLGLSGPTPPSSHFGNTGVF